ncbi:site-specific DNA-methyltransferase [Spongiactinospora rosea]|uniref:Methyltransferase n=1 Tax=Spongiactinospora rosea TaxID=2248750 RepID=A0A366LTK5_9ACTN|nr:DNA methyltransferase [Spongiactinospora rosea]RBQ17251.1 site-specific DNA-methyltransferase [Spongiactinospora rosea]
MNQRNHRSSPDPSGDRQELPLSVWMGAQQPAQFQRRGRYLAASTAHPAKMLPAIAARAIATFTAPGDVVFDPMCGIGTTLIEAVHQGRDGLGVEYEPRWAVIAQANLEMAYAAGATGRGRVVRGDARRLPDLLAQEEDAVGRVGLLLTSPPYGDSVHGQVRSSRDTGHAGVVKSDHRYGQDRANLAHRPLPQLLAAFTEILAASVPLLRPGGVVAITARSFRRDGRLIDFSDQVWHAAQQAGLEPVQRLVALLCGTRDGGLVTRASFFHMLETRRARAAGTPLHVLAHEDVLILKLPGGRG